VVYLAFLWLIALAAGENVSSKKELRKSVLYYPEVINKKIDINF